MKNFNSIYPTELEAKAAYQNHCRWAIGPIGTFQQWLISGEASSLALSRGLSMATMEDYAEAAKLVRGT